MLKRILWVMLGTLSILTMSSVYAEDKATKVNGVAIPQARIDLRIKAVLAQGQADTPALRKAIREELINVEAMSQEAVKLGLSADADVVQQLEMAKQSVLAGAYIQNTTSKKPISEDQIKQEYERVNATLDKKEYNVRLTLVATEAEARTIISQLGKNEPFEKLAQKSKDANLAARGGALGWVRPSGFVPALGSAILQLSKGSYTKEPVQTQYGWNIIKVEDERAVIPSPLAEVKPQLLQRLQQQAIQKVIADLRAKTKVE